MKAHTTAALLASAAGLANSMATSHQLCAETSFLEKGNWYCKNVNLITYENVGRAGHYNEVINMNQQTGECQFAKKAISGPLAPFNEPMSFHFRGPLHLKQFAVYLSNRSRNRAKKLKKRHEDSAEAEVSEVGNAEKDQEEVVYHDYLSLYEHSEAERKAHEEEEANEQPAFRRRLRKRTSYTHAPLKDLEKQGRIKTGTTLLQLPDGSVGFWADPEEDSVILHATHDEFQFLWGNVHKLTLKVPPPLPDTSFLALEPAASPSEPEPEPEPSVQSHTVPEPPVQTYPVPESWLADDHHHHSHPHYPLKNPTLKNHNPQNQPFSAIHTPKLKNTPLVRTAYYNAPAQHSHGLTFLGNYGGLGSGTWTPTFGNTLSYLNSRATSASTRSELLSNLTLPSGHEFAIFTDQPCDLPSCGYIQPGSVAYKGFGHPSEPDKLFLLEFSMPHDGTATPEKIDNPYSQADMPAVWMLNAKIPYTGQYHACSCWTSGCGEFDVLEVLAPGSDKAKSTFHSVFSGGDSNYFARPTGGTVTVAVVFDSNAGAVSVKVLGDEGKEFPSWLSVDDIEKYWHEDVGLYGAGGSSAFRIAYEF